MRTVIQVWTHKICNVKTNNDLHGYWGLGDLIRGTIRLHQLSKKLNFKLITDYRFHPIKDYLKCQDHHQRYVIDESKVNIVNISQVEDYLKNTPGDVLYFFTNDFCEFPIEQDTIDYIQNLLKPNHTMELFIKNTIGNDKFNIFHFRLSDIEIKLKIKSDYQMLTDMLKQYLLPGENNILISDSVNFKNYIKDKLPVKVLNTEVVHIGYSTNIKDTMLDFYMMTSAKCIYTYSVYNHNGGISGFVYYLDKIYLVPMVCMKIFNEFNFNYTSYLKNNNDLVVAGITTRRSAWRHYLRYGKNENRII